MGDLCNAAPPISTSIKRDNTDARPLNCGTPFVIFHTLGREKRTPKRRCEGAAYLLASLTILACAVWWTRNILYSDSVDLGWHYVVTDYISRFWAWPPKYGSVRPADDYPLLAHTMAALVGAVIRSNLRALVMLSVLSTCAIYALLGWGARRSGLSGWSFSLMAGTLMILLAPLNIFWGDEVIANFYYAQVVGEAAFLAFLLFISTLRSLPVKVVAACAATFLLDYVYTPSAVHLALSCPLLWTVPFLQRWRITHRFPWKEFTFGGVLLGLLALLVISNSIFFSMIKNAAYNGGINVYFGNAGILVIILVNIALFAVLAILAVSNKSGLVNPNFVLAALGGVTGAAIIQWVCFDFFGYGSPYAVSKHAFALGSMLVVAFTTVTLDLLSAASRFLLRPFHAQVQIRLAGTALAPSLFMGLALLSLWWDRPNLSLRSIETYENDARQLVSSEEGSSVVGRTVSFNSQFSSGINFTIAKVALGVSGYNQIEQVMIYSGNLRPEEQTADYFLISPVQATRLDPACEVKTSFPLVASRLVRATCYNQIRSSAEGR